MRLHYEIKGMSCAACVAHVEKAILSVVGEKENVNVSLLTNSVSIVVNDGENVEILEKRISAAIQKAGYTLVLHTEKKEKKEKEGQKRIAVLLLSAFFTLLVMYLSMGGMLHLPQPPFLSGAKNAVWICLAQFVLTLPVLLLNRKFFISGFRALWNRYPNMDSLIALGAGASVLYGLFAMGMIATTTDTAVVHQYLHDLYFESAAMILTLVSFGKLLEARAKDKTADAIKALSALSPRFATVIKNEKELSVSIDELQKGDVLLIRSGELIPADGIVIKGNGTADESALTGESMPVEKEEGSRVSAACVLLSGALTVRAEQVGENTSLSRIIRLLEDAASSKAPIARVADKVSAVFVPIVMAISAITLAVWLIATQNMEQALRSAISVLVISCPCALGLATPTAITVGIGRGAKMGVLFRSAEALEKLCSIKTIVFDKTGTLTEGKPSLTDVYVYGADVARVLSAAASIEKLSAHPLAQAIQKGAEQMQIPTNLNVENFVSLTGVGACGKIGEDEWTIGRPEKSFFEEINSAEETEKAEENSIFSIRVVKKSTPADALADFLSLEKSGKTAVLITCNNTPCGIFGIADRIRKETKEAVQDLQKDGIRCLMLTGDNEKTAAAISAQAGLDGYYASLMPEDKERIVREISAKSLCAMVGDGINDAPALARADVGIAIGAGTEIAIDSAGVILSGNSLSGVSDAHRLSCATLRIIKQNLFWALFYNAICIPVAAGVFFPVFGWQLSPMLASAAMSFSSVCVVSNALRLRFISIQKGEKKMFGMKKKENKTYTLAVEGMMCQHCVAHVKKALEGVKGVSTVSVDLDTKTATVEALSSVSVASLVTAVADAGYECKEKN